MISDKGPLEHEIFLIKRFYVVIFSYSTVRVWQILIYPYCPLFSIFLTVIVQLPSATQPHPSVYRVRLFAPDPIAAKSRFWYFVSYYKKVNKTAGEIISGKSMFLISRFFLVSFDQLKFQSRRSLRRPPVSSRTSASGSDTIPDLAPTTCTESTETPRPLVPSPSATETWVLAIELDLALSRSFE